MRDRANSETDSETQALDLLLALQPIVTPVQRVRFAYEALLRDGRGMKTPAEVLQKAKAHGGLEALTATIAELARQHLTELAPDVRLFVNVDPTSLERRTELVAALRPLEQFAARVTLELTEGERLEDGAEVDRSLAELRERGFSLAVDDLGSGYSSVAALARVKPEFAKIDISLVREVDSDRFKRRIVSALTGCAHDLGIRVVAEGVETEGELETLCACDVDLVQGFLLGRPQTMARKPSRG